MMKGPSLGAPIMNPSLADKKDVARNDELLPENDGYTRFEDGTKIESVANRVAVFESNLKHCGTTCTNTKSRVVINLNYFD